MSVAQQKAKVTLARQPKQKTVAAAGIAQQAATPDKEAGQTAGELPCRSA